MKRQKENTGMRTMVYQYGSPLPVQISDQAMAQLRLMNNFWNALVELSGKHEAAYRDCIRNSDPLLSDLEAEQERISETIKDLRACLKAQRNKFYRGEPIAAEKARAEVGSLQAERTAISERLKQIRAEVRSNNKQVLHDLASLQRQEIKTLRQQYAEKGLYWGNYNAVLNSFEVAQKRSRKEGADLKFHRFSGEGHLVCQIQGGMTIRDAFSGATNLLQITPVPPEAWLKETPRSERRKLSRSVVRMRIGSNGDKSPVWFEMPVVLHRPIADEGVIKSAEISFRKIANKVRGFLNLTVTGPVSRHPQGTGKACAIDIGWRKKEDGTLRVGYLLDEDGTEKDICLDVSFSDFAQWIVLEKFDLRSVKRKKNPEDGIDTSNGVRDAGKLAAAELMRQAISQSVAKIGKAVVYENPANTTRDCPFCGGMINCEPKADIMVRCGKCRKWYDQDWAAAKNLLNRFAGKDHEVKQTDEDHETDSGHTPDEND